MVIHVRFFAVLRQLAGIAELTLELPAGSCVADAGREIIKQFPPVTPYLHRIAYAVNQNYVEQQTRLQEGDELALIPPVSGGAGDDWIEIIPTAIDRAAALDFAGDPGVGGINVFLGTTRTDKNSNGHALIALEYEAYHEMASKQLREMGAEARKRWSILRLVLLHRTGSVAVGEPSVMIVVASPHRAEAFEACRWLIDTLKKEAAIWKKEVWEDGNEFWSGEK